MPKRIEFDANIEPLVQFIEETSPDEIVDRALEKLRAGFLRDTVPAPTVYRFLRDAIWVSVRWYRPEGPQQAPWARWQANLRQARRSSHRRPA